MSEYKDPLRLANVEIAKIRAQILDIAASKLTHNGNANSVIEQCKELEKYVFGGSIDMEYLKFVLFAAGIGEERSAIIMKNFGIYNV